MKFTRLAIPDVILAEPTVHRDERGFFLEYYREDVFRKEGMDIRFVQDNHSRSARGVLRGLHYQMPPHAQAKLVRVVRGRVFDVAVDLRSHSKTFGQWVSAYLDEENQKMLYVPAGFAHGLLALDEGTEILYKSSDLYSPQDERGVLWSDPAIGIAWPQLEVPYRLSPKDQQYPLLKDAPHF